MLIPIVQVETFGLKVNFKLNEMMSAQTEKKQKAKKKKRKRENKN